MLNKSGLPKIHLLLCIFLLTLPSYGYSQSNDTLSRSGRYIHRLSLETRPSYVVPTHEFLEGENAAGKAISNSLSAFLKYSFQYAPDTYKYKIYRGAYQGVGLAYFDFANRAEIGTPIAAYLFQGATIARLSPRLSLDYEWNFGLSLEWSPYKHDENPYNRVVGSYANAYMNINLYLNWMVSRHIDITMGLDGTHFSNGNTQFPNGGVNTLGAKFGVNYNFNRKINYISDSFNDRSDIPQFKRHFNYDLVVFGAQRKKGVFVNDNPVSVPGRYNVLGFCFTSMYNLSYKFKVGLSLDGYYDGSANVSIGDYVIGISPDVVIPPLNEQLAMGVSARFEYVMPYFTVGVGYGVNVLGEGNLKATYQMLALKAYLTRSTFLHIGYSLHNFQTPNFLMIGIGYRFNNKYPIIK